MSDTTIALRNKAATLEKLVERLRRDLGQAEADLSHVNATIRLFEVPEAGTQFPVHQNLGKLFRRSEVMELCRAALAEGPQNTRQIAEYIIRAKGFDERDKHLRTSMAHRAAFTLGKLVKRGEVTKLGRNGLVMTWVSRSGT